MGKDYKSLVVFRNFQLTTAPKSEWPRYYAVEVRRKTEKTVLSNCIFVPPTHGQYAGKSVEADQLKFPSSDDPMQGIFFEVTLKAKSNLQKGQLLSEVELEKGKMFQIALRWSDGVREMPDGTKVRGSVQNGLSSLVEFDMTASHNAALKATTRAGVGQGSAAKVPTFNGETTLHFTHSIAGPGKEKAIMYLSILVESVERHRKDYQLSVSVLKSLFLELLAALKTSDTIPDNIVLEQLVSGHCRAFVRDLGSSTAKVLRDRESLFVTLCVELYEHTQACLGTFKKNCFAGSTQSTAVNEAKEELKSKVGELLEAKESLANADPSTIDPDIVERVVTEASAVGGRALEAARPLLAEWPREASAAFSGIASFLAEVAGGAVSMIVKAFPLGATLCRAAGKIITMYKAMSEMKKFGQKLMIKIWAMMKVLQDRKIRDYIMQPDHEPCRLKMIDVIVAIESITDRLDEYNDRCAFEQMLIAESEKEELEEEYQEVCALFEELHNFCSLHAIAAQQDLFQKLHEANDTTSATIQRQIREFEEHLTVKQNLMMVTLTEKIEGVERTVGSLGATIEAAVSRAVATQLEKLPKAAPPPAATPPPPAEPKIVVQKERIVEEHHHHHHHHEKEVTVQVEKPSTHVDPMAIVADVEDIVSASTQSVLSALQLNAQELAAVRQQLAVNEAMLAKAADELKLHGQQLVTLLQKMELSHNAIIGIVAQLNDMTTEKLDPIIKQLQGHDAKLDEILRRLDKDGDGSDLRVNALLRRFDVVDNQLAQMMSSMERVHREIATVKQSVDELKAMFHHLTVQQAMQLTPVQVAKMMPIVQQHLKAFYRKKYACLSVMHIGGDDENVELDFNDTFQITEVESSKTQQAAAKAQNAAKKKPQGNPNDDNDEGGSILDGMTSTRTATMWIASVEQTQGEDRHWTIFVEGQAGLGKSSMCKFLGREQPVSEGRTVIVVDLPVLKMKLTKSDSIISREMALRSTLDAWETSAPQDAPTLDVMIQVILSRPILWILDGFDEISGTQDPDVHGKLERFCRDCFGDPTKFRLQEDIVLITSRKERSHDIELPLSSSKGLLRLALKKWERLEIEDFIKRVFRAQKRRLFPETFSQAGSPTFSDNSGVYDPYQMPSSPTHTSESSTIEDTMGSPLSATSGSKTWIDEAEKAAIVAAAAPTLRTWDGVPLMYDILCKFISEKYSELQSLDDRPDLSEITPESLLREALKSIYHREERKVKAAGDPKLVSFPMAEQEAMKVAFKSTFALIHDPIKDINQYTLARLGWFAKKGDKHYKFAHQSFGEYFRACSMYNRLTSEKAVMAELESTEGHEITDVTLSLLAHRLKRELREATVPQRKAELQEKIKYFVGAVTQRTWNNYYSSRQLIAQQLCHPSQFEIANWKKKGQKIPNRYDRHDYWRSKIGVNIAVEVCAVLDDIEVLVQGRGMLAWVYAPYFHMLLLFPAAKNGHFKLLRDVANVLVEKHKDQISEDNCAIASQALVQVLETLARTPSADIADLNPRSAYEDLQAAATRANLSMDDVSTPTKSEASSSTTSFTGASRHKELMKLVKFLREELHARVTLNEACRCGAFLVVQEEIKKVVSRYKSVIAQAKSFSVFSQEMEDLTTEVVPHAGWNEALSIAIRNDKAECAYAVATAIVITNGFFTAEVVSLLYANQGTYCSMRIIRDIAFPIDVVTPNDLFQLPGGRRKYSDVAGRKRVDISRVRILRFRFRNHGPIPGRVLEKLVTETASWSPSSQVNDRALAFLFASQMFQHQHPTLETLDLSGNRESLSSEVFRAHGYYALPTNFFANVKHLNLRKSCFDSDVLVPLLERAPLLETLDISSTELNDKVVRAAVTAAWKTLRCLDVSFTNGNVTNASIWTVTKKCKQLEYLNISNCRGKIDYAGIHEMPRTIRGFRFGGGKDNGEVAAVLPETIRHLDYSQCTFPDGGRTQLLHTLTRLKQLSILQLDGTKGVADDALKIVARCCPLIKKLDFVRSDISSAAFDDAKSILAEEIGQLVLLESINVAGTGISVRSLRHFLCKAVPKTVFDSKVVDQLTSALTTASEAGLLENELHRLLSPGFSLNISEITNREDNANLDQCLLDMIRWLGPRLTHLKAGGNPTANLTRYSLSGLALCPNLRNLHLAGHIAVNDELIVSMAPHWPQMRHLLLNGTSVTEKAVMAIADHCHYLEGLGVGNMMNPLAITDAAIAALTQQCRQLRHLDVARCKDVSHKSLRGLAENCPYMTHLNIVGITTPAFGFLADLVRHCPQMKKCVLSASVKKKYSTPTEDLDRVCSQGFFLRFEFVDDSDDAKKV